MDNPVTARQALVTLRHQMSTGKSTTFFKEYELLSLSVSVLLHLVLLLLLLRAEAPHPPDVTAIEVTIEPPQTRSPSKQIVSPPTQQLDLEPPDASKLSDRSAVTEREQIQRGDGGGIPGEPRQQKEPAKNTSKESPRQANQPKPEAPTKQPKQQAERPQERPAPPQPRRDLRLNDLKLDSNTLAMKFGSTSKSAPSQQPSAAQSQDLSDYQAFSRPSGSGAAFLGNSGISDHLPNLPDGDITLLNAKANTYAGFVRRVAVQVFTQLRSQGWEKLSQQQIRQLSNFTTIEAILSPEGKFLSARVLESSGSDAFDSVVNQSVTSGARDPNPPVGARASDGKIHFIFRARSWSQMGVNRRSGAPVEQRWLLLATGLE